MSDRRSERADGAAMIVVVLILIAAVGAALWRVFIDHQHEQAIIRIVCNSEHGSGEACLSAVERRRAR